MKRALLAATAAALTLTLGACAQPPYGPGYGQGPGMMGGGYGPGHGQGYGMMGGYGPGYGMGPGMMMGGPGMMGGYRHVLNLTDDQRSKLGEIQQDFAKTHWAMMSAMHGEGGPMAQMYSGDEKAVRQGYEAMSAMHKQMFESSLEMRKRMDAVLTDEQREQMRRSWR